MSLASKPVLPSAVLGASRWGRVFVLSVLCASVVNPPAFGQGCAMCYTTAAAAGSAAARSLDFGILVLLVPTLLLFVGVLVFTVRRAAAQ